MTLTEFLLARVAEDERAARKLAETDLRPLLSIASTINHPARLLAECEAKRRIVESVGRILPRGTNGLGPGVLMHLATVYSDHPDYDEAWRP